MEELIMLGYECLTAFVPFLIVFGVMGVTYKNKGIKTSKIHFVLLAAFAVYIIGVFYVTTPGTLWDVLLYKFELSTDRINLSPFSKRIDPTGYFLNIVLFLPFGFLLPLIWKKADRLRHALLYGATFSLLIEVSQLLNNRSTDIDDLILNTLGSLIGFGVFKKISRIFRIKEDTADYCRFEILIYTAAMLLGRFLLFNDLGLARLLYGF